MALGGLFRRLMFAIRFRSTDTFFSPNLTPESRVMMHRRIGERVKRIAPFLTFDTDPYLAISEGRLVWMQDAYTTSTRYPYATPPAGVNYIRNAVKVTIDAYHGTTVFHLLDPNDPIAATLRRACSRRCSSRCATCPRICARACATRRRSSLCRRRCSRRFT